MVAMHSAGSMRILSLLAGALGARAVLLVNSGVYTLSIGGLALTHFNATSSITATPASSAPDQAWTVVINRRAMTATLQNAKTRLYVAESEAARLSATNTSFLWNFSDSGSDKIGGFCTGTVCITLVNNATGALALAPKAAPAQASTQIVEASPTLPPDGVYEIQNVASSDIISLFFLTPFMTSFPVNDRSGLWVVNRQAGASSSSISLTNFDSGGYLAVGTDNSVVGEISQYFWQFSWISGLGQVLLSVNSRATALTVNAGDELVLGSAVNESSAWVFYPIDGDPFLP